MNVYDAVIIAVIVTAVIFSLRHIFRKRGSDCSCGCAECGRNCENARRK